MGKCLKENINQTESNFEEKRLSSYQGSQSNRQKEEDESRTMHEEDGKRVRCLGYVTKKDCESGFRSETYKLQREQLLSVASMQ